MSNLSLRIARFSLGLVLSVALSACMSERPPYGLHDASVVTFDGVDAHGPDCRALALPSTLRDPDMLPHPEIPFGCATYANLAAQLARPADAIQPTPYGGADGTAAARAVQRYNNPPSQSTSSQSTSSTSSQSIGTPTSGLSQ